MGWVIPTKLRRHSADGPATRALAECSWPHAGSALSSSAPRPSPAPTCAARQRSDRTRRRPSPEARACVSPARGYSSAKIPRHRRDHALLLYDNDISGNCYKVRLLAAQLKIPLQRRPLSVFDRSDRPAILSGLNPALRVPTLILDDGRPLAESDAILCYLARGTPMLPDDPYEHAQTLQWLFFVQYSHEPYIAVARFWAHAGTQPGSAESERTMSGGHAALAAMERHLDDREFVVADRYTIADIALYAYTHVAPEGGFTLDAYPAVRSAAHCQSAGRPPGVERGVSR